MVQWEDQSLFTAGNGPELGRNDDGRKPGLEGVTEKWVRTEDLG